MDNTMVRDLILIVLSALSGVLATIYVPIVRDKMKEYKKNRKRWREACRNWRKISKVSWFRQFVFERETRRVKKRRMVALANVHVASLTGVGVDTSQIISQLRNDGRIERGERFWINGKDAKKIKTSDFVGTSSVLGIYDKIVPFFVDDIDDPMGKIIKQIGAK